MDDNLTIRRSFDDRPGTRIRVVLRDEVQPIGWTRSTLAWMFKLTYVCAAGVFCVAVVSFAPTCGPSIGPFVPPGSNVFVHVPSGAALHRALLDNPSFAELLNDSDTAEFVEHLRGNPLPETPDQPAKRTLNSLIDAGFALIDNQPWFINWLAPPPGRGAERLAGLYPLMGSESAVAVVENKGEAGAIVLSSSPKSARKNGVLIFTRVAGSHGHLARLALAFFHGTKNIQLFDLGGGLVAIGLNGARPALTPHAPPMVVPQTAVGQTPLVQVNVSARVPVAAEPDEPIDLTNETMARLMEENVPESVLAAIQRPPRISELFNLKAPPVLSRISFFATPDGKIVAQGRIEGDVPALPVKAAGEALQPERAFGAFSAPDVIADVVLPVDARACFLRYLGDTMRIVPNLRGLTKHQRLWMHRLNVLVRDRVDLDEHFWPAIGHTIALEIHEAKQKENGTELGIVKAWMPFNASNPEALFAAGDLARARWDYLFDSQDRPTVKPPYVIHYAGEKSESFVLATGKVNAPAWRVGADGLRATSDAGADVFAQGGPKESNFAPAPKGLDSFRLRLNGPRLATTVESFVTYLYDDIEEDLGPRKFLEQHSDYKLHERLARKWASLLGNFELDVRPDAGGADVSLNWRPASLSAGGAPTKQDEPKNEVKPGDDDAPPPPPPAK